MESSSTCIIIFCTNCASRVQQSSNKARTICPYCGNFFQRKFSAQDSTLQISSKPAHNKNKSKKSSFSWLRIGRRRSHSSSSDTTKQSRSSIATTNTLFPTISETQMTKTGGLSPREEKRSTKGMNKEEHNTDLLILVYENLEQENWNSMMQHLEEIFTTLRSVYFHFHQSHRNAKINLEKLKRLYDAMDRMPNEYKDQLSKRIENMLKSLNVNKVRDEEILSMVMLLLNPMLDRIESYMVYYIIISQVDSLQKNSKKTASNFLLELPQESFRKIISRTQNMLTHLLLQNKSKLVNLLNKKMIETTIRFINFLNACNNRVSRSKALPYTEFYNCSLDHEHLGKHYAIWLEEIGNSFSYCQYPCVLSISAKTFILQSESENQMMGLAKQTLLTTMIQDSEPQFDKVFLNLSIRRNHLVLDSMNEIISKKEDLKKKLKVKFVGEPGQDMGGLTKEWFILLIRQILYSKASVFYYDSKYKINWFLSIPRKKDYAEFYLTGVLMGLAVYNSINLDVRFPPVCYRKLLSPPIANTIDKNTGKCPVTLDDLKLVYPVLAEGLQQLLSYEEDVESDICATFEVTYQMYGGETKKHCLKPGGDSIMVNKSNRKEYVNLYCNFLLNNLIEPEFREFYRGFHSVCNSNVLKLLRAEEVEILVCGSPVFDIKELKKITVYDGYRPNDATINNFWSVLMEFSESLQKLFLHFVTGSDRIPSGGVQDMQMKISKAQNSNRLPMAYTCFNQLLLPIYKDRSEMKLKLLIAMENSEGFGLA